MQRNKQMGRLTIDLIKATDKLIKATDKQLKKLDEKYQEHVIKQLAKKIIKEQKNGRSNRKFSNSSY